METKILLVSLAIVIMLAIGITSGDTVEYTNCKILGIVVSPPSTISYGFESDQTPPDTIFYITFDGTKNANYQQEMANLLRDACFSGQSVTMFAEGTEIVEVACSPSSPSSTSSASSTGSSSSTTSTKLRQTEATNLITSKIYNSNDGAKLSSETSTLSTAAKLLNNTNSIGNTNFIKRGPALNPQPLPPGISSE